MDLTSIDRFSNVVIENVKLDLALSSCFMSRVIALTCVSNKYNNSNNNNNNNNNLANT